MEFETLRLEVADGVATLTVDRPEKRNALNGQVRGEIMDALGALEADGRVRVVVITGAGEKAFIAGADIGEFAGRSAEDQRAAMEEPRVFTVVADFPKPVIAAINGYALGGGCELALACDLRIAARSARLGQPEVRLGLLPGGGGTQRLPRLVGLGRAMRLILTGELIDAVEAERIGLVDMLVEDDELRDRTKELAGSIAAYSPVALKLIKQAIRASTELSLTAGLERERDLFVSAFASQDGREGVEAFMDKRAPVFRGE